MSFKSLNHVILYFSYVIYICIRDVPIPHFKQIRIPAFRADTDTSDTTDTFYLLITSNESFCKQYQRMYLINLAFYSILNFF